MICATLELRNLDGRPGPGTDLSLRSRWRSVWPMKHPAFANLFVSAQWQAAQQALLFERKPRLATEHGLQAGALPGPREQIVGTRVQTDRQHWLGRNHGQHAPAATGRDA
ncbi:MAG: hypothetical protein IPG23_28690 [Burkholderiales bacterium]|nr:hypothetical protein [Burkholderiales bacterium]